MLSVIINAGVTANKKTKKKLLATLGSKLLCSGVLFSWTLAVTAHFLRFFETGHQSGKAGGA